MPGTTTESIKSTANNFNTSLKSGLDKSALKGTPSQIEGTAHSLSDVATDIAHQGYEMMADRTRMVSDMAGKAFDGGVDYIKKNPGKSLVGAAAVGFLAAALWRRRH